MSNHLKDQVSPYLLQHADNPVDWYPWGHEAFDRAKKENKPVFLSIGYSTCHWCHVMAHESFEDEATAALLNESFISIKVDREERPDIDSIYMSVCQAFTGSGGWPTSIFLTPDQKPFFAGTYFPLERRFNMPGFKELLQIIRDKWNSDSEELAESAEKIINSLNQIQERRADTDTSPDGQKRLSAEKLITEAVEKYKRIYDPANGGFGTAPKFPAPHNLFFLIRHFTKTQDKDSFGMVEKTLIQMYRGGIFDHIGYGFSRYSTDRFFLVPHFEKMLYDNALLIIAYCRAYEVTGKSVFRDVAEKTAAYVKKEMTSADGGFYSAQDADSEGEEGKYYVFSPSEIISILGETEGKSFNACYNITIEGNFEGKSIPNLLKGGKLDNEFSGDTAKLYRYRKERYRLHLDDKILTSWNSLMIAAMCNLYRISKDEKYLDTAVRAGDFIDKNLCTENTLYVSIRDGKRGTQGFLDDYSNYIYALLALYDATLDGKYLARADSLTAKVINDFWDEDKHGFYLYGIDNENLIFRPKETYDGAMPSGNSMMAYNLVRLSQLRPDSNLDRITGMHMDFMKEEAEQYPTGNAMFLTVLYDYMEPPELITVVYGNDTQELPDEIPLKTGLDTAVRVVLGGTDEYPLKDGKTTYYICREHSCLPPCTELPEKMSHI